MSAGTWPPRKLPAARFLRSRYSFSGATCAKGLRCWRDWGGTSRSNSPTPEMTVAGRHSVGLEPQPVHAPSPGLVVALQLRYGGPGTPPMAA